MFTWGPRGGKKTDPYFGQVLLLLHGEGSNGSTTFIDSSSYNRTVTRIGLPVISTSTAAFGGASILSNNSGNELTCSMGAELAGLNWCVEGCLYRNSAITDNTGIGYFGANLILQVRGGDHPLRVVRDGSELLAAGAAIPFQSWTSWAITCEHTGVGSKVNLRIFQNGAIVGQLLDIEAGNLDMSAHSPATFSLGRNSAAGFAQGNGYTDEYRITMATRYTEAYTPSGPFPDE